MKLSKATVILRGYTREQVNTVAMALVGSEVKNIEVTLNSEHAFETIEELSKKYADKLNIGAGTVLNLEDLKKAIQAGARFVLAPGSMDITMLQYCKEHHVISIPGAFTPSEIADCFQKGADIVKVFPANEVSVAYANKVQEPLGDVALMAVGGVNKENVKAYLTSGYQYVGSAGGIFKKEDILSQNVAGLRASLKAFEEAMI